MRFFRALPLCVLPLALMTAIPAVALESQAVEVVGQVPAPVRQVMRCGEWSESGVSGFYRVVLVDVSEGSGTEVYIQRLREAEGGRYSLALLETTPIRQLNNDHAQYQVLSAQCIGKGRQSAVELIATFEHDEGDWTHRIRIALQPPNLYAVRDTVHKKTPSKIAK
jgi:hypothetical protein